MQHNAPLLVSRRSLLRNGMLIASGYVCSPGAFTDAQLQPTMSALRSWTIGNDLIQRKMSFQSGTGISTVSLTSLSTQTEFILASKIRKDFALEFSFRCNERTCTGRSAEFDLLNAEESPLSNGKSLIINLRHKQIPLEVSAVYVAYDGHPAIRKHLVLRNSSNTALHFSHINIEALGITLGPENETTLLAQYGTIPREIFYTGRSEDVALLMANARTGNGIAIISEVPGYMKRTEIGGWDDPYQVKLGVLYDTDIMPFARTVPPGEEFTTASVSLIVFRNGDGFNDPHWVLPAYAAKVLVRRVDAQGPPWIYNTWEPFQRRINHDVSLQLIDAAATMEMDIFTIDDGWQQEYGENTVNLASFPGGLQSIIDAVEARGMRLGLWIPLAAIGTATRVYRDHPDWASLDQEGKLKTTQTMGGGKVVMCMASAFRDSAADRVIDAIDRYHLAYVKLDITTVFNAYGEAPGCWAKNHCHGSWAESLNLIYEGIAHVTRKIYQKHPDVLIDLTFELWGQKHIIDAGLLVAGDLDWMSNVDDGQPDSAGPLQVRQLLYQRAASMPVESMLIGNMHADMPTIQEGFATVIGSAPVLNGDLRKLSAADRKWYSKKINWFKKLRRENKIRESFFPLGSWQQTTSTAWDGFARFARSGNGMIALFRNKSRDAVATIKLPLLPERRYKLHSIITDKDRGVFTKADFAHGIPIRFPYNEQVEVFEVSAMRA